MTPGIRDKVVFITGPARGIGAATARLLAARGARLALAGMEPGLLAALASELREGGAEHAWFECDVTDQAGVERAVAGTVRALGRIDVVIANAGVASHGSVATTPAAAMARTIDVNLTGVVRAVSATLPHVTAARGYYLLMSSASSLAPAAGLATYAASKVGVEHFGSSLRLELAYKGVGVGVAHPCWIDTEMVRGPRHDLASFNEMLQVLPGPFGKVTTVAECAAAIADTVERRRRKVYVPRSLARYAVLRQLFASPLAERVMGRHVRRILPRMEREVALLGRPFGAHSVGLGASPAEGAVRGSEASRP